MIFVNFNTIDCVTPNTTDCFCRCSPGVTMTTDSRGMAPPRSTGSQPWWCWRATRSVRWRAAPPTASPGQPLTCLSPPLTNRSCSPPQEMPWGQRYWVRAVFIRVKLLKNAVCSLLGWNTVILWESNVVWILVGSLFSLMYISTCD